MNAAFEMTERTQVERLDADTIESLLDADDVVRTYLMKAIGSAPVERTLETWRAERPDDAREVFEMGSVIGLAIAGDGDALLTRPDDRMTPLEEAFAEDLREAVHETVREVQSELSLTPLEFCAYLLGAGGGRPAREISMMLDVPPADVSRALDRVREKARTAMRTVDLCRSIEDAQLEDELAGWGYVRGRDARRKDG